MRGDACAREVRVQSRLGGLAASEQLDIGTVSSQVIGSRTEQTIHRLLLERVRGCWGSAWERQRGRGLYLGEEGGREEMATILKAYLRRRERGGATVLS